MNGWFQNALRVVLATALLVQIVAGRAALVCIGEDHVGLTGDATHDCCDVSESHGGFESVAPAGHHDCTCIDIGVSDSPMHVKRALAPCDVDVHALACGRLVAKPMRFSGRMAPLRFGDLRQVRSVVLLI